MSCHPPALGNVSLASVLGGPMSTGVAERDSPYTSPVEPAGRQAVCSHNTTRTFAPKPALKDQGEHHGE
jgi:hypothetical protein